MPFVVSYCQQYKYSAWVVVVACACRLCVSQNTWFKFRNFRFLWNMKFYNDKDGMINQKAKKRSLRFLLGFWTICHVMIKSTRSRDGRRPRYHWSWREKCTVWTWVYYKLSISRSFRDRSDPSWVAFWRVFEFFEIFRNDFLLLILKLRLNRLIFK